MDLNFKCARARLATTTALFALLSGLCATAQASYVEHTLTATAANRWRASFSVTQGGGVAPIESFTLYFDAALTSALGDALAPPGWDPLVVQPDTGLGSDGYLDLLALDPLAALNSGARASGFAISFDWHGLSAPGGFRFSVNDPVSFAVLESGFSAAVGPAAVPEPASWALAGLALAALACRRLAACRRA